MHKYKAIYKENPHELLPRRFFKKVYFGIPRKYFKFLPWETVLFMENVWLSVVSGRQKNKHSVSQSTLFILIG